MVPFIKSGSDVNLNVNMFIGTSRVPVGGEIISVSDLYEI